MVDVVIYGSAGQSQSISEIFVRTSSGGDAKLVAFVDDFVDGSDVVLDGVPVVDFDTWTTRYRDSKFIIGLGSPADKRALAARVEAAGGGFLHGVWDETAGVRSALAIGHGTYIGYGTYVGPRCSIGNHVAVLTNCSIGHDVSIGDYSTICPIVAISGYVQVEDDVFIGAGATILNGSSRQPLVIGKGAVIAAGSVVTKSVPAGTTVAGNPARSLREIALERRAARRGD